jgi:protease-4
MSDYMKRHPFLAGILILLTVGFVAFLIFFGITSAAGGRGFSPFRDRVGVVPIKGIIVESKSVVELINKYGEDSRVKAIVVRIDSPGGGVSPSQEIFDALSTVKKKKKVVASMGSVAASGGYYIACAADRIVANPGSLTGSIGALMQFANVEELLKKVGLKSAVIKSGKYKDIGAPTREMTPEERVLLQGVVDDIYDQFLGTVSASRNISVEELRPVADGRIFTGRQALKMGLVDELGDMERSVDVAANLAGIKGKPEVVYPKEKGVSVWRFIADEMASSILNRLRDEAEKASYQGASWIPLVNS